MHAAFGLLLSLLLLAMTSSGLIHGPYLLACCVNSVHATNTIHKLQVMDAVVQCSVVWCVAGAYLTCKSKVLW